MVHEHHHLLLMGVGLRGSVDEVAALSKLALSFLGVSQAHFSLVCPLLVAGGLQLLGAVGELAPRTVGAGPVEGEVLAERGLVLGVLLALLGADLGILPFFVISGDIRLVVEVGGSSGEQTGILFNDAHVFFCNNYDVV